MARTKHHRDPEYTLNIFRGTDPVTREDGWIFLVRTIKEFVSFNYEILLSGTVHDNVITLQIGGIHAPLMVMPGMGPAKGLLTLKDLSGGYSLSVRKLNKEVNNFEITVGPTSAKIRELPSHAFLTVSTDALPLE